jgi:hypothetical protein
MREQTLSDLNKSLFEQVFSDDHLREAFRQVKRNRGKPGVDGVSIEIRDNGRGATRYKYID